MVNKKNERLSTRGVYVINERYQIVYFDNSLKELYPTLQNNSICYRLLRNRSEPCSDCPLVFLNNSQTVIHTSIKFNSQYPPDEAL